MNYRTLNKRYTVNVCKKGEKYGTPGERITVIKRVLIGKAIGNFNPLFCMYNKTEYLVHSIEGDLSDPFRREDTYTNSLYIEIE